jgi:hypothetical protein
MPSAFDVSNASKPTFGVHLHWALPDALTRGVGTSDYRQINFPYVPNRWLVVRFNIASSQWQCKLWVVESDYIQTAAVGTTASDLSGLAVTTIALQSPGATSHVGMAATLSVTSADGQTSATVITAAPVEPGDTKISVQPTDFSSDLPAGSTVQLIGTSAFLDPFQTTSMEVVPGQATSFNINQTGIGTNHTIEAWEARTTSDTGQLYLQAVGPGNIHFAAYVPSIENVFSFIDTDLPPEGTGVFTYSYMVVGWYSDTQTADPLRGINTYIEGIWKNQDEWQSQTPAQRFKQLLDYMKWSVQSDPGSTPPSTSLYHGLVADVQWPVTTLGNAGIDSTGLRVAVGNTAIDALAALVQAEAQLQAKENPSDQNNWLAAGNTLTQLMQAAMYDLLDDYGKPGGSVLIEQQIETAWFGSYQGGILWEVVADVPQVAGQAVTPPQLTPDQSQAIATQLAALNQSQRDLDDAVRKLQSLQSDLYIMWLKIGRANSFGWGEAPTTTPPWAVQDKGDGFTGLKDFMEKQLYPALFNRVWDQYCTVGQDQASLPSPTDAEAANNWANQNWTFIVPNGTKVTLAQLGLKLKAAAQPPFWHPNDPVLMVSGVQRAQKHGEDGRYNSDGTLTCRLPGQTITSVQILGQPAIDVPTMLRGGINLSPCASYTKIPGISNLVQEAFFVDPVNAQLMAGAASGDATAISQGITDLLEKNASTDSWGGTIPAPFALALWDQAWAPLFLEWEAHYYPTGATTDETVQFSLNDWKFDGTHYTWKGTGFNVDTFSAYKGRTLFAPHASLLFKDKIQNYLKNNTRIDSGELDQLIATVAGWDVLSQSLTGFSEQLVTLLTQETFPPPPCNDMTVQCPRSMATSQPCVTALIGEEYHAMPQLDSATQNYFFPVRGGFLQFEQLQVVDAFGQTFQLNTPNTGQGFQPILGQGLAPTSQPDNLYGLVQLPPRVVQDLRLDFRFLVNDGKGQDIVVSNNANAVCGWLLPNHLDGGISVYDAKGILLGELLPLAQPDNWRPAPGARGDNPPPQQPSDIPNAALRKVIASIAAQPVSVFEDLLNVIDETLWMVDPLGGRKDQFLSVLIGRPLAVVQAGLQLSLLGDPLASRLWNDMVTPTPPYTEVKNIGDVETVAFPVRLGSLELRDDGLIGYFLPSDDYSKFYSVHIPEEFTSDSYVQQIVAQSDGGPSQYQGDINLDCQGGSMTITMLLDPRGKVHAYSGILPVMSSALPAHLVEDFIKQLKVTFRAGPIIADPGALRVPQPAEDHGVWKWLQRSAPTSWEEDLILDADDSARLPDAQLQLREGWLQLSDLVEPT